MILKGNARGGAANLARHLSNIRDNDKVELVDVRGLASQELATALMDMEAIASGTSCEKHLYSLSINPSKPLKRVEYDHAIERIEKQLGLEGHARVVVFHHKKSEASGASREHCHVVWSRIDDKTMTAAQLSFDRMKLRTMARELARDFGLELPRNLAEDRGADRFAARFNDKTYAERAQEKRSALSPDDRREAITAAFRASDSGHAFVNALEEKGFYLAQGDRRAFVVVDLAGEVHSLRRQIEGAKAKDIAAKLAPLEPHNLPTVEQAQALVAQRQRAQTDRAMTYGGTVDDLVAHKKRHADLLRSQAAELKAIHAKFDQLRATAEQQQTDRLSAEKQVIKEQFKPQWKELLKAQEDERAGVKAARRSVIGRVQYYLDSKVRLNVTVEGKGHLSSAFDWLAKGKMDVKTFELKLKAERLGLARQQTGEFRAREKIVKQEFTPHFDQLSQDERTAIQTRRAQHRLEFLKSERLTEAARERVATRNDARRAEAARQQIHERPSVSEQPRHSAGGRSVSADFNRAQKESSPASSKKESRAERVQRQKREIEQGQKLDGGRSDFGRKR